MPVAYRQLYDARASPLLPKCANMTTKTNEQKKEKKKTYSIKFFFSIHNIYPVALEWGMFGVSHERNV